MHLELSLLSFLVQRICIKYLYCSKILKKQQKTKTKQNTTKTNKQTHLSLVYNSLGFDFDEGSSSWIHKDTSWPKIFKKFFSQLE